ncbi:glycosyltransferase [Patescibacteria group bacterium]|nr:glycosyltransferase [Patescibacteria group bacterium]
MNKITSKKIKSFTSKPFFNEKVILKKDLSYPKISIVTPSFNQGEFLERTILSVLNQNYPNLEYIIIDGGSTDNSVEIIKKYEKYISYWVSEKDEGQGDALNKGFLKATGNIVGWQNSDDIYLPKAFLAVANEFKAHSNADIIFGNRLKINKTDKVWRKFKFTPFYLTSYWYCRMSLSNQSAFWKRKLFSEIGMIDKNISFIMDYDFFLRAGIRKKKFVHINRFLGGFRIHESSKTSTFDRKTLEEQHKLLDKKYGKKLYLKFPLKMYSVIRDSLYYIIRGDLRSLIYLTPIYIKPLLIIFILIIFFLHCTRQDYFFY